MTNNKAVYSIGNHFKHQTMPLTCELLLLLFIEFRIIPGNKEMVELNNFKWKTFVQLSRQTLQILWYQGDLILKITCE